ncbi:aspartate--tRNA ligase, partial [Patescibacteria group bacterium]|nr:aspartate--tRNA ligase [Patescibacteria group bacterium]
MLRTHTCGQLSKTNENEEVVLTGWVNVRRDHGGLIFLDIRDRYGVTQTTFYPDDQKSFEIADRVKPESVVMVKGQVIARPQEMINKKLKTGEIEVKATSIEVLSASKTPPFELDKADGVDEEIRLKYRYLDLRRQKMQHNLEFRQQVLTHIRNYLVEKDFIEVETPLLTSSSPEGARDYLVPSRVHPGQFYALPQAPQLYKQLLMVASFDKYFQIAPCFRDEDARADRSPGEFYQLDLEMSFVDKEDVFEILEPLMIELTEGLAKKKVQNKTFPIVTYKDALEKYGTDKPDLRFDMTFVDITEQAHESDFKVFQSGECIKGIKVDGGAKYSRKDIDNLIEKAQEFGAKGLAWVKIKDNKFESQIAKFFKEEVQQAIIKKFAAQDGDFVCFIADSLSNTQQILGDIRNHLGEIEG